MVWWEQNEAIRQQWCNVWFKHCPVTARTVTELKLEPLHCAMADYLLTFSRSVLSNFVTTMKDKLTCTIGNFSSCINTV